MEYSVFGESLPAVSIKLNNGESIYTQSGGMAWMDEGIKMETNMKGGLMKGLGRMFSGESLFMVTYTATKPASEIVFASTFPGTILTLEVGAKKEYICQKSAFLCGTLGVELGVEFTKRFSAGAFGGEGFILQRLTGEGIAFLEVAGSVVCRELQANEVIKVDTGNVVAFEKGVGYEIETVKGFTNIFFGGEGLFLTKLKGPGRVWLQTLTMQNFAGRLMAYMPIAKN